MGEEVAQVGVYTLARVQCCSHGFPEETDLPNEPQGRSRRRTEQRTTISSLYVLQVMRHWRIVEYALR
jgi:hypothetical protein